MKKALSIVKTIVVILLVIVAVGMMIFTIVSAATFDRNDRDLFGYKAFIVLSDSMSATDFDAGDLVIVKEVDPATLKEGDIIEIDIPNAKINAQVSDEEFEARRKAYVAPQPNVTSGWLARYMRNVSSAVKGAVME